MASSLDSVPPWLQITPNLFTSAMESGASVGLQVAAQSQRAQELAAQRAEKESQDQERQAQEAERQRQFDESHLLNVQKVAQDAAQLQQQTVHQQAMESRLLGYDTGRLAVEKQRADREDQLANSPEVWVPADTTPGGAPGHWNLPGGKVSTPPASVMDTFNPSNTADPIYAPDGKTILGYGANVGAHSRRILSGPTTGKLTDSDKAYDQRLQHEAQALERLTANPIWQAQEDTDKVAHDATRARLAMINQHFSERGNPASVTAPVAGTNAPTVLAPTPAIGVTSPVRQVPAKKSDLVTGDLYAVKGGVWRWNGKEFEKAQ